MREYIQPQSVMIQNGTSNNVNMPVPPQIGILQSINNHLDDLIDHAKRIGNRQSNLAEKIFGPTPCEAAQLKGIRTNWSY
jgi:hypothetical protein